MSWVGAACLLFSLTFAAHVLRYVTCAGGIDWGIRRLPRRWRRRLQGRHVTTSTRELEFWSSIEAGVVFSLLMFPAVYGISEGWLRVSMDARGASLGAQLQSFACCLALHDTYFYWTHRWMHLPRVFPAVHAHHHASRTPSAWAAFSFHPIESVIQGLIYLLIPLVLPIHIAALTAFVVWATLYSAFIHCGYELGPGLGRSGLYSSVDHDLHHSGVRGNYGLYFTFWDRVMGTRVPEPHHRERA